MSATKGAHGESVVVSECPAVNGYHSMFILDKNKDITIHDHRCPQSYKHSCPCDCIYNNSIWYNGVCIKDYNDATLFNIT